MTIESIRIELGDTSELPVMTDTEIQYFLDKNSGSLRRATMDTAKSMLLKLSMVSDEQVDIFSIKGAAAAKNYMQALKMYISNPDLNPIYNNAMPYAGGISKSDMCSNNLNTDNNIVINPSQSLELPRSSLF